MFDIIKDKLGKFNIDLVSCLALGECKIIRPYLLDRCGIEEGSVIIFAVPYLSPVACKKRNVSAYAVSRDYHIFFSSLFEKIIKELKESFPENKFAGFTDHSPINEIEAAAKSGLGVIGENHLLITEKYSSFVFLGEIITDALLPSNAGETQSCIKCGKCIKACPVNGNINSCLSALTQKKGELNENELITLKKFGCAWGCDICQEVCPYTVSAIKSGSIFTKIDFFNNSLVAVLTSNEIEMMDDAEFGERAYSWRGKQTIIRNLKILEEKEDEQ